MTIVGVEYCPRCWSVWDQSRRACSKCGTTELVIMREGFVGDIRPIDSKPEPSAYDRMEETIAKLRDQLATSLAQLKKLRAKTKHHLAERDRYRDLYLESERKRRELVTNNPNF